MPTDAGRIPAEKIMTRFRIFAGMVLCLVATAAAGSAPSAGNIAVREVVFDGCHFKMNDPYGGTLQVTHRSTPQLANYNAEINPQASKPFETWIQFSCQNPVTDKALSELAGIELTNKGWILDSSPDSMAPRSPHRLLSTAWKKLGWWRRNRRQHQWR